MKNVCIYTGALFTVTTNRMDLIEQFRNNAWKVTVLYDGGRPFDGDMDLDQIDVHSLGTSILRRSLALAHHLWSGQFDLLLSFNTRPNILCGLFFKFFRRTDIVWFPTFTGLGSSLNTRVNNFVYRNAVRWLFKPPVHCFTQNRDDQGFLNSAGLQTCLVPGSGFSAKRYKEYMKKTVLDPNDMVNVMYFGRLIKDKGVLDIAKIADMVSDCQLFKFSIVGFVDKKNPSSLSKAELEELKANESIKVITQPGVTILDVDVDVDVMIFPSRREGLPRTILEAMSMGILCIGYDVPGVRDVIINGTTGFLVSNPNEAAAILRRIKKTDPSILQDIRINAAKSLDQFSGGAVYEAYAGAYQKRAIKC